MITVFTPIHKLDTESLNSLCESLANQTFKDFEWVVLLNGPILLPGNNRFARQIEETVKRMVPNSRVGRSKITNNIGALKADCCELAEGDVLVELDYDDMLTHNALEVINDAFKQNDIQYFYSNCWEFLPDGKTNTPFGAEYGWQVKPYIGDTTQNISFPALPQYLRRIEWAPNHVRAFTRVGYEQVGGYNKNIQVGDDHDLICRFFIEFGQDGFYHYDDVLYHYRVHENNTVKKRNADIQAQVDINYCNHTEAMFKKWAKDEDLLCLDLGGRFNSPKGYTSVDLQDADIVMNLNLPWFAVDDNSVGVLRAYHVLEHLPDPIHFFNEAFRVLAPGGLLLIEVPSSNGLGAFSDPTHISFFNRLSFEYYTNEYYAKFIRPSYTGKFQRSRIAEFNWDSEFGPVPIVSVQMICLKGWYDTHYCGERKC